MNRINKDKAFIDDRLKKYKIEGYDNELNNTRMLEAAVLIIKKAEEDVDDARKWARIMMKERNLLKIKSEAKYMQKVKNVKNRLVG